MKVYVISDYDSDPNTYEVRVVSLDKPIAEAYRRKYSAVLKEHEVTPK